MIIRNRHLCFLMILTCFSTTVIAQSLKKITFNEKDESFGHYLVAEPVGDTIRGVLVLFAGFGQHPEDTPPETKLHQVAQEKNILTVFCAGGNKLYVDQVTEDNITKMLKDILGRYKVARNKFVIGGYSAGGMIAMRYTELCNEFPEKFPIQPQGVFAVDAPIDIFTIWDMLEETAANNYSAIAVEEANRAMRHIKNDHGIPREHRSYYAGLTAFSMNKADVANEKFLKETAVRVYHDVDIAWRIKNRNQTVHNSNYEVTAELINRLLLMGNSRAEFIQTFQTGYRANGMRHPHSWSIVHEEECVKWMLTLIN